MKELQAYGFTQIKQRRSLIFLLFYTYESTCRIRHEKNYNKYWQYSNGDKRVSVSFIVGGFINYVDAVKRC